MIKIKVNLDKCLIKKLVYICIIALIITIPQVIFSGGIYKVYIVYKPSSSIIALLYAYISNFMLTLLVLWIASINKVVFKIVVSILVIFLIVFLYQVLKYKIVIDSVMFFVMVSGIVVHAKALLLNMPAIIGIVSIIFIIILFFILHNIICKNIKFNFSLSYSIILVVLSLFCITIFSYTPRHKKIHQYDLIPPFASYGLFPRNLLTIAREVYKMKAQKFLKDPEVKSKIDFLYEMSKVKNYKVSNTYKNIPQTIVFVLGESVNSSHMPANGYYRNTTPLLLKQQNITFIKNTVSCATYTAMAQPCMVKPITRNNLFSFNDNLFKDGGSLFNNSFMSGWLLADTNINSFAVIFGRLGYKVISVKNSDYLKEGTLRAIWNNKLFDSNYSTNGYVRGGVEREKYQDGFKKALLEKADKKIIMVYLIGSHCDYPSKFEDKDGKFKPYKGADCMPNGSIEKNNNAYDNTIIYMDKLMNWTIETLKQSNQNAMLFYFSDHGENTTDKTQAYHGMPYVSAPKDVINPAAFTWFSNNWLKNIDKNAYKAMQKYKTKEFSHDNIFHSVLDCAKIEGKYINKKQSLCYEANK